MTEEVKEVEEKSTLDDLGEQIAQDILSGKESKADTATEVAEVEPDQPTEEEPTEEEPVKQVDEQPKAVEETEEIPSVETETLSDKVKSGLDAVRDEFGEELAEKLGSVLNDIANTVDGVDGKVSDLSKKSQDSEAEKKRDAQVAELSQEHENNKDWVGEAVNDNPILDMACDLFNSGVADSFKDAFTRVKKIVNPESKQTVKKKNTEGAKLASHAKSTVTTFDDDYSIGGLDSDSVLEGMQNGNPIFEGLMRK